MKIRLDLDALAVESFETGGEKQRRGTVEAHNTGWYTCKGAGCYTNPAYGLCGNSDSIDYNTCYAGCGRTDAPQNSCAALIETGCC